MNAGDAAADVVNISNLIIGPAFDQGTVNATGTLHVTGRMDVGSSTGTGILSGSGNVTVGGLLTLFHGTMSGSGTTSANGGMSLQIGGGGFDLEGRTPSRQQRPGDLDEHAGSLHFPNGAVFNNNGTFDIQVDAPMANGNRGAGPANAINNNGIFKKTAGTATARPASECRSTTMPARSMCKRGDDLPRRRHEHRPLDRGGGGPAGLLRRHLGPQRRLHGLRRRHASASTGGTVNLADTYTVGHTEFQFGGNANFNANSSTTTLTFGGSGTAHAGRLGQLHRQRLLTWHYGT